MALSLEQVVGNAVTEAARRLLKIEMASVISYDTSARTVTLMMRGGPVPGCAKLASYSAPTPGEKVLVVVLRQGTFVVLGKIG